MSLLAKRRSLHIPIINVGGKENQRDLGHGIKLHEVIGEGSSSIVRRASKGKINDLAVKIVRCESDDQLQNAQNEYEILRKISHASIVRVIDFVYHSQTAWIVQEFIEGKSLGATVRERVLLETQKRSIVSQLVEAVRFIHACGVIHRDINPNNLMIRKELNDEDIHVKLIDFNVATESETCLTPTGTMNFSAPEQLDVSLAGYDSKVDIWSCGMVLWFMHIRREPVPCTRRVDIHKWLKDHALQHALNDTMDHPLQPLIVMSLVVDPQMRVTASDLLDCLLKCV